MLFQLIFRESFSSLERFLESSKSECFLESVENLNVRFAKNSPKFIFSLGSEALMGSETGNEDQKFGSLMLKYIILWRDEVCQYHVWD